MSYQVLARKWRPQRFSELVGQEHVVNAISNALDNNRLHHAYLFTGTRGVGKTTIARIFAKSLNCETGQSANPCGKCDTCIDIDQGRFVDLLEIDAASRTKVEDTRELLDNVQYSPTRGDYKVYLIDEVHMLSKHSFNALLKTLEEPPPHVKFLLATTDPQKLPVTILSRCLQFNLKALSREQIANQLVYILEQESIEHEKAALSLIARAAQGSMRDALSLTDQAIAQGNNTVLQQTVSDMLGLLDKTHVLKILQNLAQKDSVKVFDTLADLAEMAPDFEQVLQELNATLHQIALTQFVPDACKLETTHARTIYQFAKQFSAEQVQLLYQIGLDGIKTIQYAPEPRVAIEMTLLRMLAFSQAKPILDPDSVITAASLSNPVSVEPSADSEPMTMSMVADEGNEQTHFLEAEQTDIEAQAKQIRQQTGQSEQISAKPETSENAELARTKAMLELQQRMQSASQEANDSGKKSEHREHPSEPERAQKTSNEGADADDKRAGTQQAYQGEPLTAYLDSGEKLVAASQIDSWSSLVEDLELNGLVKQAALHSVYSRVGNHITLVMDNSQQHILNNSVVQQIETAFSTLLNESISLSIDLGKVKDTPFILQQRIDEMRHQFALKIAQTDESINQLSQSFNASLIADSVKPR